MTERITISLPDEMAQDIHAELSYGDNRSEWIRDAIREKLERDNGQPDKPDIAIESVSDERQTGGMGEAYQDVELPDPLQAEIERYREQLNRSGTEYIDARVAAAKAVGRMLVAEDGVSRSQAQERLLPQYEVPGVSKDTWWQRTGKDRFGNVDEIGWNQTKQKYVLVE